VAHTKRLTALLLAGALATTAPMAAAVDDLFLRLEGVQGESQDAAHRGEIEILSYTQAMTGPYARGVPVGTPGAASGKITCGPVTITKFVDRASPVLMLMTANAKHVTRAVITFRRPGQPPAEYYKVTLDEVIVTDVEQTNTRVSVPNPAPPRAIEKVSMLAQRYTWEYLMQGPDGKPGRVPTTWDCARNAPG